MVMVMMMIGMRSVPWWDVTRPLLVEGVLNGGLLTSLDANDELKVNDVC